MVKIICEGGDDFSFLKLLLEDMQKNGEITTRIEDFSSYIQPMGGKSKLLDIENYGTLNKQIGRKIKKVLFIFDCDFEEDDSKCGDIEKSIICIKELIQKLKWNIKTDYYIFSKNLDYFLIDTLKNKSNFVACEECLELKKINKNRKLLTGIYNKLYPKKPYDFPDKHFKPLKDKLKNLFKES